MVRPRGKSNPMNPSRLLKTSSSSGASVLNLQMAPLPALAPALEEDLESQARASLSLFGFGVPDAVNWCRVSTAESPTHTSSAGVNGTSSISSSLNGTSASSSSNSTAGLNGHANGSSNSSASAANSNITLLERVCPIGTNAFLWNTMSMGESGVSGMNASLVHDPSAVDASIAQGEEDSDWDPLGNGHVFTSKILQQYLVKCIAFVPASVDEVVDLIIRSDRDDMETPMHHLVGIKTTAAGIIYRRRRRRRTKHAPRRHNIRSTSSTMTTTTTSSSMSSRDTAASISSSRRGPPPPSSTQQSSRRTRVSQSAGDASDSSSSGSDDDDDVGDDDEVVQVLDDDSTNAALTSAPPRLHVGLRATATSSSSLESHSNNSSSNSLHQYQAQSPPLTTYLDEYRASLTQGGQQGNLSLKWVVGEKTGRMFTQRANYCLLDYECVLVNDWDDSSDCVRPMYVRALQSVYIPQCQPWLDELGSRPTDLQPTGIMVRDAKHRPGFVEVQFVASVLEKAQLPLTSRRAKLRALGAKIAKLEEVLTSRRLSQSLLAHQPHWVHNRDRPVCHCCEAPFNLRRRRHHCRLCGEICCSECCPKKDVALPEIGTTSVRVCVFCVKQKRRHSGEVLDGGPVVRTPVLSPVAKTPATAAFAPALSPPPLHAPLQHSLSSSSSSLSSPSEYYLSTSSSYTAAANGVGGSSSLGDRKASLASSMLHKLKSSSSIG